jgi:hypothetical protein
MKITMGNKICLVVGSRSAEAAEYESKIQRVSSTGAQPFVGINFVDGKCIGGRTMSDSEVKILVAAVTKAGATIEE